MLQEYVISLITVRVNEPDADDADRSDDADAAVGVDELP